MRKSLAISKERASDLKSQRFQMIATISVGDFYATFQKIQRWFGCDFAERSATPNHRYNFIWRFLRYFSKIQRRFGCNFAERSAIQITRFIAIWNRCDCDSPGRNYIPRPPLPPISARRPFSERGGGCTFWSPPAAGFYTPPLFYTPPTLSRVFSGVWGWGCIKFGPVDFATWASKPGPLTEVIRGSWRWACWSWEPKLPLLPPSCTSFVRPSISLFLLGSGLLLEPIYRLLE